MRRNLKTHASNTAQHGFSMLEILITLVIVAIALLGTAGLQVYAMRVNQSGQFRTQAIFLASDIAERMEANRAAAIAGNYVQTLTSTTTVPAFDCTTTACNSANLANWDLSQWGQAIAILLPQATWQISQTSVSNNPITYSIVISWTDRSSDKTSHGETFSYTATRTVSN